MSWKFLRLLLQSCPNLPDCRIRPVQFQQRNRLFPTHQVMYLVTLHLSCPVIHPPKYQVIRLRQYQRVQSFLLMYPPRYQQVDFLWIMAFILRNPLVLLRVPNAQKVLRNPQLLSLVTCRAIFPVIRPRIYPVIKSLGPAMHLRTCQHCYRATPDRKFPRIILPTFRPTFRLRVHQDFPIPSHTHQVNNPAVTFRLATPWALHPMIFHHRYNPPPDL